MTVDDQGTIDNQDTIDNQETVSALPLMSDLWQSTLQWQPSPAQQTHLQTLYELVLEGNRQFNLTRITEPDEFWEKHLWDSLRGIVEPGILDFTTTAATPYQVIDIGTGAGFPGVPVAIAHPDWAVTLLDSTRKKTVFLEMLAQKLGLSNATVLTDRVEQVGQQRQYRATYDLALIRAVASAPVCAEYALPLLKIGGLAVLYRGQWSDEEDQTLPMAVEQLGGTVEQVASFATPLSHGARHCIYLRKTAKTPYQFPRPVGIPTQKPL
ncbi:MAG TPA: 16S rRNA (guanine(527)-N(7))-methyltransferase RsmG [Crinalium sp.]|jgi:16S rRNA (guanine527-N7)-methyltransferase